MLWYICCISFLFSMTHYICKGTCKGETDDPNIKTCQAEGCDKFAEPLIACECEDGKHGQE